MEIKFALIYENEVKNVFICENYELANVLARASYGDEAFAVEATRYATTMGDKYENGIFYNKFEDGTLKEAPYIPSPEEEVRVLKSKLEDSQSMLVLEYEHKSALEDKINQLTNMITTLYEKMEVTE